MRKLLCSFIVLFFTVSLYGQDSYAIASNIEEFSFDGNMNVTLIESDKSKLEVTYGEGTISDNFESDKKNGVFTVKLKKPVTIGKSKVTPSATVKIYFVPGALKAISASSGATLLGELTSENITLNVGSKSVMSLKFDSENIDVNATSAGKVTLTGSVKYLTIKANTASYVNTITMDCESVTATAATNSECYIAGKSKASAKATSNASIFVKDGAEIEDFTESTLGYVKKMEADPMKN